MDEEIYLLSAVATVVHDKQIANTLGYKVPQQLYSPMSFVASISYCIENDVLAIWTRFVQIKPSHFHVVLKNGVAFHSVQATT